MEDNTIHCHECGHESDRCTYVAKSEQWGLAELEGGFPVVTKDQGEEINECTYFCEECQKPLTQF